MNSERRSSRSRSFEHRTASPCSLSQRAPKHVCSLCHKPRSSTYQNRHPIAPGQTPEPGVCSRSRCAKTISDLLQAKSCCSGVVIYEIHHYYHINPHAKAPSSTNNAAELHGESSLAGRTELPGDSKFLPYMKRYGPGDLSLEREDPPPPPVNTSNKPTRRSWLF